MVELNAAEHRLTDMTNLTDFNYSVASRQTDAAGNQDETEWLNINWSSWFGYYKTIPELKRAIDARAMWTVGKGFEANPWTTTILENISGWGQDTFNTILKNMIITAQINGDAYAEIVRGEGTKEKPGILLNLKPLDPGAVKIIVNREGRIIRYELTSKFGKDKDKFVQKFKPEEIFHLCRDRVADEIHGVSIIEAVKEIIDARNECVADQRKLMHRNVVPIRIWEIDTDDPTKISEFQSNVDKAVKYSENIIIPKGTVIPSVSSVAPNSTLNPLPWLEYCGNFFYQAVGIPQIIVGGSQEFTEATAKIAYLSFQQSVEDWQMDIERQVWEQLYLRIELGFPASLQNELLNDEKKQPNYATGMQKSEMTAGENE
jgi:hypothetical protein